MVHASARASLEDSALVTLEVDSTGVDADGVGFDTDSAHHLAVSGSTEFPGSDTRVSYNLTDLAERVVVFASALVLSVGVGAVKLLSGGLTVCPSTPVVTTITSTVHGHAINKLLRSENE